MTSQDNSPSTTPRRSGLRVTAAGVFEPDGRPVIEPSRVVQERERNLQQWERDAERRRRIGAGRAGAEERSRAVALTHPSAVVTLPARMPEARPAAHRPSAKRTTSASRDGPDDGSDDDPEPGEARPPQRSAHVGAPEALARPDGAPAPPADETAVGSTLPGPSPRFSRPWRPSLERDVAERLRALDDPGGRS